MLSRVETERIEEIENFSDSNLACTVNNLPHLSCKKHNLSPVLYLRDGKLDFKICKKCYEEAFPNWKLAKPNPHGQPLASQISSNEPNYVCSFEDCKERTDYHNSCMMCKCVFCPEHLTDGFLCRNCLSNAGEHTWN